MKDSIHVHNTIGIDHPLMYVLVDMVVRLTKVFLELVEY